MWEKVLERGLIGLTVGRSLDFMMIELNTHSHAIFYGIHTRRPHQHQDDAPVFIFTSPFYRLDNGQGILLSDAHPSFQSVQQKDFNENSSVLQNNSEREREPLEDDIQFFILWLFVSGIHPCDEEKRENFQN